MEVLAAFGIIGALWYGGSRVIEGALTPGEFFSFTTAVVLLYRPDPRDLSRLQHRAAVASAPWSGCSRSSTPRPPSWTRPRAGARRLSRPDRVRGRVLPLSRRGAGHAPRDLPHRPPRRDGGARGAVRAPGKTTLMDLLPRFHDVTAGRITIDGHDLRQVTVASLRALIGLVTQETFLFTRRSSTTSPTAGRARATTRSSGPLGWRRRTSSSRRCPTAIGP